MDDPFNEEVNESREKDWWFFSKLISSKQARKLKAVEMGESSVWSNFSAFGVVGWTIALPTLMGTGIGIWLDRLRFSRYSCTLMLMSLGLLMGVFLAWRWIETEWRSYNEELGCRSGLVCEEEGGEEAVGEEGQNG